MKTRLTAKAMCGNKRVAFYPDFEQKLTELTEA
jgi:hypothetical protein